MPVFERSKEDILASIKQRLSDNGFDTSDASVNVLFADAISEELEIMYAELQESDEQRKVSSATGIGLDTLGFDKNVARLPGEDDENYRFRIAEHENKLTSVNQEALRAALLTVEDILDVEFVPYTQGPGSGLILIMAKDPFANESVLERARQRIEEIASWGNRYAYMLPTPLVLRVNIETKLHPDLSLQESNEVRDLIRVRTTEYLSTLRPGESFYQTQLKGHILDTKFSVSVSKPIRDLQITRLLVDGELHDSREVSIDVFYRIVADTSESGVVVV